MIDLYDLLRQIQGKPGMYIGGPSIRNLYMFLNGYQFTRRQMKIPLSIQEEEFRTFQPWLQQQLSTQTTTSWCELILSQSDDEADAFAQFFTLLQTFLQEHKDPKRSNGHLAVALETAQ